MSVMVVNQGSDPIVLVLRSDRGTLELTKQQCAALYAEGKPQEMAGPLNMPKPPQGASSCGWEAEGPYGQKPAPQAAPNPAMPEGQLYWKIHNCLIDQDGFWRGGSHDMARAVLDTVTRNPALFAREAIDAAHATGFRDGAADMEKRRSERADRFQLAAMERDKASELLNAEGHDPRNGLEEQVKNLINYTASVERERDAALDTISKQKSDYDTLSGVLASKTKECQEAQDDLRSTQSSLARFQAIALHTDRAVVALVEGREPEILNIPNGCLKIHLAQLQAKLAAALSPDKDAEAFASALGKDRDAARADAARLQTEVAKLQGFKQLVHERLDQMKVPTFDGETCRVAARLTFLQEKLAAALGPDKDAEAFASALGKDRDAEPAKAHQLRVQLDAIITSTQPFLHTVAALIRNHPVLGDGMGVGQLANGAETASLWRELYSTWRRLTDLRASEHLVKDRCDAPAGARTGG